MGIVARQSIKGSLANYLGIIVGFVTTFFVVTDCLTAEEIGLTRILVDAAMLFSGLAQLGTSSSIIRFFPYFHDGTKGDHGFFAFSLLLPLVGFMLFAIAFFCCKQGIIELYSKNSPLFSNYVFLLLPLTFFALSINVLEANANVLMRITVPKFVREVCIRLFNLVSYLLYGHGVIGLDTFVVLFCSSYAMAALLDFVYLLSLKCVSFRPDWKHVDKKLGKNIMKYTLLVTITGVIANVSLFNSLFLGAQAGLALAGIYTISSYIANVVGVPSRSLNAISGPVMARHVKECNYAEANIFCKQMALHNMLVSMLIFFFIAVNLDALFTLIPNGEEYRSGMWVVYILGLSNALSLSISGSGLVISYSKYYWLSLPFSLFYSLMAIVLNITLIPLLGVSGAACATLFSTVLYQTLQVALPWVKFKIHPFSAPMLKVILIVAILTAVNLLWGATLHPLFGNMQPVVAVLADACCKTLLLAAVMAVLLIKIPISSSITSLIDKLLNTLKLRKAQ